MSLKINEALLSEAHLGHISEVREILRRNPTLDVNWRNDAGWTALHFACASSYDSIVALLLAHPGININQKDSFDHTPFLYACVNGHTSCVCEMLKDSRVMLDEGNKTGLTPLWHAAFGGYVNIVKCWIASGREMCLSGSDWKHPISEARRANFPVDKDLRRRKIQVATLLERFQENPEETKLAVRMEIGWYEEMAAERFALVVFVSDGLLRSKATRVKTGGKRTRFFNIATQLPLELQMALCYRLVGSGREIVPRKHSEPAFKKIAKNFPLRPRPRKEVLLGLFLSLFLILALVLVVCVCVVSYLLW